MKAGRQVEKSTTLGNKLLGYSCLINYFKSLYVSPSAEQTKVFSNDRLADPISMSPVIQAYTNTKLTNAVFHKKFINYSQIRLRYAYLTADRVHGIPTDLIDIDEIQDILVDNIPVIEECASHSEWKIFIYSGTPNSLDNTIEYYWANFSTQNEWVVPWRGWWLAARMRSGDAKSPCAKGRGREFRKMDMLAGRAPAAYPFFGELADAAALATDGGEDGEYAHPSLSGAGAM